MREILKQSSWLFFAQIITRFIGFFYTIFLARNLGVGDFGLYTVALSFFSLVSTSADFGFNQFLIREIVRGKSNIFSLLWNIAILRLVVSSILFTIFALILYALDSDSLRVSLSLLAILAVLPQGVALTLDGAFVALRKLQYSAISSLIVSFTTAILGVFLVIAGFGPIGAVNALILGQVIYLIVLIILFNNLKPFRIFPVDLSIIKKIILGSLPYGILGVIGFLSFRLDTIILSYFRGNFETGIYGVAYKFLDAVVFIPTILALASFPIFVKTLNTDLITVKKIYSKNLKISLTLGLAIMVLYLMILPEIVRVILPDYSSSIQLIQILALSIPFIFMHIPLNQLLLSSEKYLKQLILIYSVLFSINIILYLTFIPLYGTKAAAWVTVLSEFSTFLTLLLFLKIRLFGKLS